MSAQHAELCAWLHEQRCLSESSSESDEESGSEYTRSESESDDIFDEDGAGKARQAKQVSNHQPHL